MTAPTLIAEAGFQLVTAAVVLLGEQLRFGVEDAVEDSFHLAR
jgi:hypothetical protein